MLLIGSLVFFLLTAFYQTEFAGRLKYISALFVLSAVLITRISIVEGAERAAVLSVPLAMATWVTLAKFTVAGIFAVPMVIGVTWWAAHKLTRNCTLIDEQEDDPGGGLTQTMGMDAPDSVPPAAKPTRVDETPSRWFRRWILGERPHAIEKPGVWVLYFCLATLPLFGLGQFLMSAEDVASRQAAFGYLVVYVSAALGLLGTTSFLSLRRYLRQRRLEMPTDMAAIWPASTAAIIVLVIVFCSILPRPRPAYSLTGWIDQTQLGKSLSERLKANRISVLKDNEVQSEDFEGDVPVPTDQESTNEVAVEQASDESSNGDSDQQNTEDANRRSEQPSADGDQSTATSDSQGRAADGRKSGDQQTPKEENDQSPKDQNSASETEESPRGPNQEREGNRKPKNSIGENSFRRWMPDISGLGGVFRWLYWLVFAVGIAFLAIRHGAVILAAIRQFIKDLMAMFGKSREFEPREDEEEPLVVKQRVPFAAYKNPFHGKTMADAELVRYSFLALEAWAHEQGLERAPEETPHEFSQRIGRRFPQLVPPIRYLVQLYDLLAYRGGLPSVNTTRMQQLWQQLYSLP